MDRREFLKRLAAVSAAGWLGASRGRKTWLGKPVEAAAPPARLARARGKDLKRMVVACVEKLGGMGKFVSRGDKVVIKPNVGWDKPFRFRANTHPDIVEAVAELVLQAGPAEVVIVDHPVGGQDPAAAFRQSRIGAVGEKLKVRTFHASERSQYSETAIPGGENLKKALVIKEILDADKVINLPVAKHHVSPKFTGALKNWMGIVWSRREFHRVGNFRTDPAHWHHIGQCIVDINLRVRPALTIMDASSIMTTNGPWGPGKLVEKDEVIAGADPVAVDVYSIGLFDNIAQEDVFYIEKSKRAGLGETDIARIAVEDAA